MTRRYTTTSAFLLTEYAWRGFEHLFPNATLYTVAESPGESDDLLSFPFCTQCETTFVAWRKEQE